MSHKRVPRQERFDHWLCQFLKIILKVGMVGLVVWQAIVLRAPNPGFIDVTARPSALLMLMSIHAFMSDQVVRIEQRHGTGPWTRSPKQRRSGGRSVRRKRDPPCA